MSRPFLPAGLLLALSLTACIAPSVVAPEDRMVADPLELLEWAPAAAADLPGTYVSVGLEGPLAAVLRKLVYRFEPGGAYTASALLDGDPPHFKVLTGAWVMQGAALVLDEASPAQVDVAGNGWLRFSGEEGRVILRREADA